MNDIEIIRSVPKLPPRAGGSHKGTFGHVLAVGGSRGMVGAAALVSLAALRGGAGLVTFAVPEPIQLAVATLCPCATSVPLACGSDGAPSPAAVRQVLEALGSCDVLAMGPGMGTGGGPAMLVRAALEQDKPLVLDADGLNNLAAIDGWAALRRSPMIMTPHPGEFARLVGKGIQAVQADRVNVAVVAQRQWQAASPAAPLVVVLKGEGTVVTDGRRVYVNDTGNPGLATGGTGDILTGLTAAVLGQMLGAGCRVPAALFDAACLAVHAHGRAGDLAADAKGPISLIATDLLDTLPAAMRQATA